MLRSPSDAEANSSASVRLISPIMIDSNSSKPGASIDDILPSICNIVGNVSPYAQGTNPLTRTFSDWLSSERRDEISMSPLGGERSPSVAKNI